MVGSHDCGTLDAERTDRKVLFHSRAGEAQYACTELTGINVAAESVSAAVTTSFLGLFT
jgi:hypothetical protein